MCTSTAGEILSIGIALNLAFAIFNVVGMMVGLRGRFVNWYLDNWNGMKLLGGAWCVLLIWAVVSISAICRP